LPIRYVEIFIDVKIKLKKTQVKKDKLRDRLVKLLSNYFCPIIANSVSNRETWDFGQNVYRSKVISFMKSFPEVENVYDLKLSPYNGTGNHVDKEGNIIIDDLNLVFLKDVFITFE
jgi:hypothetical protein